MPNDPLDTNPPAPPPPPPPSDRRCVCEFCGCQLTPRGEIIRMGEVAKEYRKHEDRIEAKDKEIVRLNEEIVLLKQERDALRGATTAHPRRVGQLVE